MMLKGLGDLGNIMKLQKEMKVIQKRIIGTTMEGESQNGKVKAIVNGEYRVMSVKIEPEYAKTAGTHELEKMIMFALNSAVDQIKEFSTSEMENLTGGLNIPGLGNLLK